MAKTSIEWADYTFNPWRGCQKVSPGCANCYAETLSKRNPSVLGEWGPNGTRVIASEGYWKQPLKWDCEATAVGERHKVFCASLADVFEDRPELFVPRVRLFNLIHDTPHLDWLLLTKRPENIGYILAKMAHEYSSGIAECWMHGDPLPNVWLGVSVETQQYADERITLLLQMPAAVRFLSVEPMLGPVDLCAVKTDSRWPGKSEPSKLDCLRGFTSSRRERFVLGGIVEEKGVTPFVDVCDAGRIDLVIVGCESGPRRRPMQQAWAESLAKQCREAGTAFFMKQIEVEGKVTGEVESFPECLRVREFPGGAA